MILIVFLIADSRRKNIVGNLGIRYFGIPNSSAAPAVKISVREKCTTLCTCCINYTFLHSFFCIKTFDFYKYKNLQERCLPIFGIVVLSFIIKE
jgi:hypothetical protein